MNSQIEELTQAEAQENGMLPTPEQEVENSFVESDGHFWKDTRLDPYSAQRQVAAQYLGLHWGFLGADEMKEFTETGNYPGMMQDAIIILYLCHPRGSKGKDGIDESYAACDPKATRGVRRRMLDWAAKQNITMNAPEFLEAFSLMMQLTKEASVNQFAPEQKKGTTVPN